MKQGICPHCKREIELDYRVGFSDTCIHCGADLHVCIACKFYAPGYHNDCMESSAPIVVYKDRANRCDYFEWNYDASLSNTQTEAERAKAEFERLFGKKD